MMMMKMVMMKMEDLEGTLFRVNKRIPIPSSYRQLRQHLTKPPSSNSPPKVPTHHHHHHYHQPHSQPHPPPSTPHNPCSPVNTSCSCFPFPPPFSHGAAPPHSRKNVHDRILHCSRQRPCTAVQVLRAQCGHSLEREPRVERRRVHRLLR